MKKQILLLSILCGALSLHSQVYVKSPEQQLVEQAIDGCFFEISQSYRLEDPKTKNQYGRNGANIFGSQTSFGVKVSEGFFITDVIAHPWEYDSSFQPYKSEYVPVLYETRINDSIESAISIPDFKNGNKLVYFVSDKKLFDGIGLSLNPQFKDLHGWLVWLVEKEGNAHDYISYKKQIDSLVCGMTYEIDKPNSSFKLVGAVYLVPMQCQLGYLKFGLAGIVVPNKDKWCLVSVCFNETLQADKSKEPIATSGKQDELTLVENENPKKKAKRNKKK